jgi:ankyrin repeat protein
LLALSLVIVNADNHISLLLHCLLYYVRDAIQIAARNGALDIVKFLVKNGADSGSRGRLGETLFHVAAGNGHVNVMKWLVERGMMHTLVDMHGQSAAHVAARRSEVQVLKYLHDDLNMDLQQLDFENMTPLQHVPRTALKGNEDAIAATRLFFLSLLEENEDQE